MSGQSLECYEQRESASVQVSGTASWKRNKLVQAFNSGYDLHRDGDKQEKTIPGSHSKRSEDLLAVALEVDLASIQKANSESMRSGARLEAWAAVNQPCCGVSPRCFSRRGEGHYDGLFFIMGELAESSYVFSLFCTIVYLSCCFNCFANITRY